MPIPGHEVPLQHVLKSDDWETIEAAWGIMPARYICVYTGGLKLRKKFVLFGGSQGATTPACVNYGGGVAATKIQIKGKNGQVVNFVQGMGTLGEVP